MPKGIRKTTFVFFFKDFDRPWETSSLFFGNVFLPKSSECFFVLNCKLCLRDGFWYFSVMFFLFCIVEYN